MAQQRTDPPVVEQHTIAPIQPHERHGKPRDLFNLWFGVNVMPLTIVTGLLGPTVFNLSFGWTLFAIVLGNAVGAVFMALHSAQGVNLGVAQMIQSRGQFGIYGSVLVLLVVLAMYLGFLTSIMILGGQSLAAVTPALTVNEGIVVTAVVTALIVAFGYRIIHSFNRFLLPVFAVALVLTFIWAVPVKGLPPGLLDHGGHGIAGILGMFSTAVGWQISYAPYVSDYSRYMPLTAKPSRSYWMTWGGTTVGAVIIMAFGAVVGLVTTGGDAMAQLAGLIPVIVPPILLVFALGAIDACVINLYGPVLTTITLGQTFNTNWAPRARGRLILTVIWAGATLLLALFTADSFLTHYSNFLIILLYFLAPWSKINLVDYYLVRHAHYDIPSFYRADGGVYGQFRWTAVIAYVVAFCAQIPFMNTTFFQGALFDHLHGVDLTWLVGVVVAAALYYPLARAGVRREPKQDAVAPGDPATPAIVTEGLSR